MSDRQDKITLQRQVGPRIQLRFPKSIVALPLGAVSALRGVLVAAAIIAVIFLVANNFGVPAFHYAYDYRGSLGQQRFKTACRYVSPFGSHQRAAQNGRCPWIIFVLDATR